MAKAQHDTGRTISGKSAYGTESSFVVTDELSLKCFNLQDDEVLCKDERGYYITFLNRVDSGLADPRRWGNDRLTPVQEN